MAILAKLSRCHQAITTTLLTITALGTISTVGQGTAFARSIAGVGTQSQLMNSRSSFSTRSAPARYFFTVYVPETAQPLKAIKVKKILGVDDIAFRQDTSKAFIGTSTNGTPLPLASVGGSGEENTLTVAFDQPVQPGSTVTIAVRPRRNPNTDGVYLFQITGFTTDSTAPGQDLGVSRIHVYR